MVRPAARRRNGGGPQRADLRRAARPDVVAGARARTGLRPGRRPRDELQLPDGRQGARRQRPERRPARLPDRPPRRRLHHRVQPDPLQPRAAEGARDGAIIDTAIQEIDISTGLVRWEWHSLDHVPASESETPTATDTRPWDWFHLNSIDVEGAGTNAPGDLFISARNTWAGYQLQGGSGRILWRLGGLASSFKMGPGTQRRGSTTAACCPTAKSRSSTTAPTRRSTTSRAPCGSRSTSPPTQPGSPPPTPTPTRRCSPPARATRRRSPTAPPSSATAGCPRSASTPRRRARSSTPTCRTT